MIKLAISAKDATKSDVLTLINATGMRMRKSVFLTSVWRIKTVLDKNLTMVRFQKKGIATVIKISTMVTDVDQKVRAKYLLLENKDIQ